jgi:hypothetical protein
LLGFASVLALLAAWLIAAESLRTSIPTMPQNSDQASSTARERTRSTWAARLGLIRGDLWAESALTFSDLLWTDARPQNAEVDQVVFDSARRTAEAALADAPHDARIWLLLAGLDARFDFLNRKAAGALRMSYYTARNELALAPVRLIVAVRSEALADSELRDLVQHDIRTIVTRSPNLRPVIRDVYLNALPNGRTFMDEVLKELDPEFLATLRGGNR